MSFSVNKHFEQLTEGDVIYSFKGSITSELINNILETIELKLNEVSEEGKIRKKLYNVLVESLQNLYHHVEETPDDLLSNSEPKFGIIVVKKIADGYSVSTGNLINSSKIKFLKDKIDKINSLTKDELKDMYKFILNHQKLSAKGGGGLGLVDIARKTGNKLGYNFHPVKDDYFFFVLDINVN